MESLEWVDRTYAQKHQADSPSTLRGMYYANLVQYNSKLEISQTTKSGKFKKGTLAFFVRSGRRAALSISIYLLTFMPSVFIPLLPLAATSGGVYSSSERESLF